MTTGQETLGLAVREILALPQGVPQWGGRCQVPSWQRSPCFGGIDGIIHEDALGLDAVCIQAKRYSPDNKISRPEIQRF
ncbi:MAG: restriction endonuclease, partial [Paracoccaceae bacterium]